MHSHHVGINVITRFWHVKSTHIHVEFVIKFEFLIFWELVPPDQRPVETLKIAVTLALKCSKVAISKYFCLLIWIIDYRKCISDKSEKKWKTQYSLM